MKLCIALDLDKKEDNLNLAKSVSSFDDIWLKVGFRTFIRDGIGFLEQLKVINSNFKIFLDLKLYDIPNTMADASSEIAKMGLVDMFNIHASSGGRAMRDVSDRIKSFDSKPLILAVTALTSFDNSEFESIYGSSIDSKALEFAKLSYQNGIDGVVCSAFESKMIKDVTDLNFLTLTPAIRPFKEPSDDQRRVATIEVAKENLVDFIVVGRPIYQSKEPFSVVEKILASL